MLKKRSSPKMLLAPASLAALIFGAMPVMAQDNSPYTRYGIGDIVPSTNIDSRAMGGLSAAYSDFRTINYANPASYASFLAIKEANSKKLARGMAIFDVGINFENRTLTEPNNTTKFTANNALFSHIQVGVPLRRNWGLAFGLRPVTRISYRQFAGFRTGIDSTILQNEGDGGSYLASAGVGHRFVFSPFSSLSLGVNGGYLFGKSDYSRRISLLNPAVNYTSGNYQTKTTFGDIHFNGGLIYEQVLDTSSTRDLTLTIGLNGNIRNELRASRDRIAETYFFDESSGNVRIDSVSDVKDIKGQIVYPSSIAGGFTLRKSPRNPTKEGGWMFGVDYAMQKWSDYRDFGAADPNLQNSWMVKAGGELRPKVVPGKYLTNMIFRAGVFTGKDYVVVGGQDLPIMGASAGFGLPFAGTGMARDQYTMINVALEYIKRGNNDNVLKENMFRVSVGLSLGSFWFAKRKYD